MSMIKFVRLKDPLKGTVKLSEEIALRCKKLRRRSVLSVELSLLKRSNNNRQTVKR